MKIIKKILGLITFGAILVVSYGLCKDFLPEPAELYDLYLTAEAERPEVLYEKIKAKELFELLDSTILSTINMTFAEVKALQNSVGNIKAMEIIYERLDQKGAENNFLQQQAVIAEQQAIENAVNNPFSEIDRPFSNANPFSEFDRPFSEFDRPNRKDSPIPIKNKGVGADEILLWAGVVSTTVCLVSLIYVIITN